MPAPPPRVGIQRPGLLGLVELVVRLGETGLGLVLAFGAVLALAGVVALGGVALGGVAPGFAPGAGATTTRGAVAERPEVSPVAVIR